MSKHVLRYKTPRLPALMHFSIRLIFHSILWEIKRPRVKQDTITNALSTNAQVNETNYPPFYVMRSGWKMKLKMNLFFPLLIKTSPSRQLHVLCQSNVII